MNAGRSVVSFDEGYHSGANAMRQHIVDAIRTYAREMPRVGREEAAARDAVFAIATDIENRVVAP